MRFCQSSHSLGVSRHEQINREITLNGAKLSAEGKTMSDLRITGVTNNQLELQAPDGTRHYLEITDDLLKALKPKPVSLPPSLSPREIQAEIRLGTTVSELVARTGVSEELITKFAAPIISELAHIAVLAKNIRLSLAGDRFTDPTQIEFGTVMDQRLEANGATNINWIARKSLEGDWLVSAEYSHNSSLGKATWSFDPKNLFLVPENQSAMQLSNALPLSNHEDSAILKSELTETHAAPQLQFEPEILEVPAQTAGLTIVPELVEVETFEVETETQVITIVETETRTTFHVVEIDETEEFEDSYSVKEVPKEAEHSESLDEILHEEPQHHPEESLDEILHEEPQHQGEEDVRVEPAPSPKTQSTSRWAEVLFGTKNDED